MRAAQRVRWWLLSGRRVSLNHGTRSVRVAVLATTSPRRAPRRATRLGAVLGPSGSAAESSWSCVAAIGFVRRDLAPPSTRTNTTVVHGRSAVHVSTSPPSTGRAGRPRTTPAPVPTRRASQGALVFARQSATPAVADEQRRERERQAHRAKAPPRGARHLRPAARARTRAAPAAARPPAARSLSPHAGQLGDRVAQPGSAAPKPATRARLVVAANSRSMSAERTAYAQSSTWRRRGSAAGSWSADSSSMAGQRSSPTILETPRERRSAFARSAAGCAPRTPPAATVA